MNRFSDHMSASSWALSLLACVPTTVVILEPSFAEFAIAIAATAATILVTDPLCSRSFSRVHPDTRDFHLGIDPNRLASLSYSERKQLIESMMRFPKKFARFNYFSANIKTIPALLLATFVWSHPQRSDLSQFLLALGIAVMTYTYLYGAAFLDAHTSMSAMISDLHARFDLSEVFSKVKVPYRRRDLFIQEAATLGFVALSTIVLQNIVIAYPGDHDSTHLAVRLLLTWSVGIMLMARVWYGYRRYLADGLSHIFKRLPLLNYQNSCFTLPLHTSPLLASFEQAFNELAHRFHSSEKELSAVVTLEAEKTRYRALGEMSALIAHDLSGPLHVAQFCVDQLHEKPDHPKRDRYIEQLSINIGQAVELITSIKARLKNPEANPAECSFLEAHRHVVRLLETQFSPKIFAEISFELDPELASMVLRIPRVDLIHILDNLYRNSIQNLLTHEIPQPRISVRLGGQTGIEVMLVMMDNGTGLSAKRFEELTNYEARAQMGKLAQRSLGLRLTRRLIEINGGTLTLIEPMGSKGTTFCLKLKPGHPSRSQCPSPLERPLET